jgi:aminopeptidase N
MPRAKSGTRRVILFAIASLFAVSLICPPQVWVSGASVHKPRRPPKQNSENEERNLSHYKIEFALDIDARSFSGVETIHWINTDDHPANMVLLHLYSNLRSPLPVPATPPDGNSTPASTLSDEPRLEITDIRPAAGEGTLQYSLDDPETTLRVNLREPVPSGGSTDFAIKFKGTVPEIDPEETGLLAHVIQQVGAALRSERETRRARDINFFCRGMMMMGTPFPLLAARDGGDWKRKVEPSIGDVLFSDVADYDIVVTVPADFTVFTSGRNVRQKATGNTVEHVFSGNNLRDFAIVAAKNLRMAERTVNGIQIRSVYVPEHEVVGMRVLNQAADAVRVFTNRFGAVPLRSLCIIDAPMVAGLGSMEFSGLTAIASAFYVNFDSPQVKSLPELIREQRSSVEDSLEWTVAHVVAHQWWGSAVGSDPQRSPVLDEALANYSALLYYKDVHSEARATSALDDQLRGVYKVYRTFGGEDMSADKSAREYHNFFQYSAIVASKGALMFAELRRLLGDQRFFSALRNYYEANRLEIAEMDDLKGAFLAEAPATERRAVSRTFNRWLSSKRGDEDITPPDPRLARELGLNPSPTKSNDRNAFARLGKFFWQQMTRIH